MNNPKYPYTMINIAMSLDGKIVPSDGVYSKLGSHYDSGMMRKIRALSDAVMVGANTIRNSSFPLMIRDKKLVKRRCEQGKPPHPTNILISSDLNLPYESEFFLFNQTEKIIYTSNKATMEKTDIAKQHAEIYKFGDEQVDLNEVLLHLKSKGIENLLVEGGGTLISSLFELNAIDRIYLTLTPWILGGINAKTFVEGNGFTFDDRIKLKLSSFERIEDELYLSYDVMK